MYILLHPQKMQKNCTYYLEVSLLAVIKETTNFYMDFVVDVPVVPAGAIVLKCSITSILFWDLATWARHRIHLCVLGAGFSRSARVNCRHSWNWTTISLVSFDWVWMHWRTSWGRARDFSRNYCKDTCYNRRLQVTTIINWIKRKNR